MNCFKQGGKRHKYSRQRRLGRRGWQSMAHSENMPFHSTRMSDGTYPKVVPFALQNSSSEGQHTGCIRPVCNGIRGLASCGGRSAGQVCEQVEVDEVVAEFVLVPVRLRVPTHGSVIVRLGIANAGNHRSGLYAVNV